MNTKRKETSYTNFMKHAHLLEPNRMKELVGLSQRVKHKLSETSLSFDSDSKNEPEGESEIEPPDPFNNLTPQSKLVLTLAREQASRFNHKFLGSEHLLLGLIKIGQGGAANVLKKMGLDLETVRLEVEKQVGARLSKKQLAIVITPRVKKVLNRAAKEAKQLQHAYVGTEHILLGLLREGDGVAARVLNNLDVDLKETRKEIIRELFLNRAAEDGDAGGLGLTKER
jgi:chorismate mutase